MVIVIILFIAALVLYSCLKSAKRADEAMAKYFKEKKQSGGIL